MSVPGIGTVPANIATGAASTATTQAATETPSPGVASGSASYLTGLLALGTTGSVDAMSGLPAPLSPGNAEALLLLVESNLDKATSANRAAGLVARFGSAQGQLADAGTAVSGALSTLASQQDKLTGTEKTLAEDTDKRTALQGQRDSNDATIATLRQQIKDAPDATAAQNLQVKLDAALVVKSDLDGRIATADQALVDDLKEVEKATAAVAQATSALQGASTAAAVAISLVATGLRGELAGETQRTADVSSHRDNAYDETADIAKRQRDGEVDRADQDGTRRSADASQRAATLATHYAEAVASALATLRAFAASPPPIASPSAAAEVAGRVRLAL